MSIEIMKVYIVCIPPARSLANKGATPSLLPSHPHFETQETQVACSLQIAWLNFASKITQQSQLCSSNITLEVLQVIFQYSVDWHPMAPNGSAHPKDHRKHHYNMGNVLRFIVWNSSDILMLYWCFIDDLLMFHSCFIGWNPSPTWNLSWRAKRAAFFATRWKSRRRGSLGG